MNFASALQSSSSALPAMNLRLDRNNYSFWRFQVLAAIRAHGFDDLISQFVEAPPQFLPSSSHEQLVNPEFPIWIRRDQFLLSWLISSIAESMLGHITRCVNSRDVWLTLESLFQSQSKARAMQLRLQLQTQKRGDLTIDEFFLKMRSIADSLAAIGKSVPDDDLILHILAGFGPEFDAVVVNLTNRTDSLNLQEVQYSLQAHEIRLMNQHNSFGPSVNMVTRGGGRVFDQGGFRGGGRATDQGGFRGGFVPRGRGGRGFGRDSKIVCQLCGKNGHVALKCFKRFDVHFTGPPPPQALFTDVAYDSPQEEAFYAQQVDNTWYADSGATAHVTHEVANLQVGAAYDGSDQLQVGDGHTNTQGVDEGESL